MHIEPDVKLDFDNVLIRPKRSTAISRKDIDLVRTYHCQHANKEITCVPIVASNMAVTGSFRMATALAGHGMLTCLHKFHRNADLLRYFNSNTASAYTFYGLGLSKDDSEKLRQFSYANPPGRICFDVANGYTTQVVERLQALREEHPNAIIMAGNVCTPEMVQELIIVGRVDIVKVGIGPGSVCTTRVKTGVGYPQLSAIIECADAAHGLGGLICADGGCRTPADIVKAFGAGADFVMLGGMLAGTAECDGEVKSYHIDDDSAGYMEFFGMASETAQEQFYGGVKDYCAAEGKTVRVPYRGPVEKVIQEITGGLRSACAYVGAARLKDLSKCCTFVRVCQTHNTHFS